MPDVTQPRAPRSPGPAAARYPQARQGCAGQWPGTARAAEDLPADPRDPDGVRTKALARCGSRLQGTPPEGRDLAAQPRAAEELARNHGTALAQAGAAYRQEQQMPEATFTGRSVLVTGGATRGSGTGFRDGLTWAPAGGGGCPVNGRFRDGRPAAGCKGHRLGPDAA